MYEMCLNRNHRSNFKWFATSNSFLVFSFFFKWLLSGCPFDLNMPQQHFTRCPGFPFPLLEPSRFCASCFHQCIAQLSTFEGLKAIYQLRGQEYKTIFSAVTHLGRLDCAWQSYLVEMGSRNLK